MPNEFNIKNGFISNNNSIVQGGFTATTISSTTITTSFSSGSTLFAGTSGQISQNNSQFFWDNVNNRLGIGTNVPDSTLVVRTSGLGYVKIGGVDGRTISSFNNAGAAANLNFDGGISAINCFFSNIYDASTNTQSVRLSSTIISLWSASTERLRIANNGNVLINTTTDAGYKLDVNGTARVSGTTTITPAANTPSITSSTYLVTGSGTTPLLDLRGTLNTTAPVVPYIFDITNTASGSGSFLVQFRRNGNYILAIGLNDGLIYGNTYVSATGAWNVSARENAINGVRFGSINSSTHTSGNRNHFNLTETFAPTSGTGTYSSIQSNPTINQTGGASGTTRGLYINPTLTSAADFRAIETTVGNVMLNTTSGNTLIGTSTNAGFKLDVNGTARFSGIVRYNNTSSNYLNIDGSNTGSNNCVISNRFNQIQIVTNTGGGSPHIALLPATGGAVGINTSSPNTSAITQIDSTTQGFLPPRMTTTQKNAIATPAAGLVVYDTTTLTPSFYNGTNWQNVLIPNSLGNVLVGTTTDDGYKLDVSGGTRVVGTKGSVITSGSSTTAFITVSGSSTVGGTGYTDFIQVTNTAVGATNINKTFRVNNTGGLEIVNSNYNNIPLSLSDSGNLVAGGTITPQAWSAGQIIKETILSNTEVTISTTTIATSTSDTDFLTYNYTPVSSNSYLIIHYHLASFNFASGTGNDEYISRIKVDGGEITWSYQSTINGNRSGVLFPLTGRYTNSNTTSKSIVVACRRAGAGTDDSIIIQNSSTSMWLRITEIGR